MLTEIFTALGLLVSNIAGVAQPAGPAEESVPGAYLTGYSYWDNTPPGSSEISNPVLHPRAGGVGSYGDPITVAVGHDMRSGTDVLDYAEGTRFYFPSVRRYGIAEDTCGDGPRPDLRACHALNERGNPAPPGSTRWLDLWVDGAEASRTVSDSCMDSLTGVRGMLVNPKRGYPVASGSAIVHDGVCDDGYS